MSKNVIHIAATIVISNVAEAVPRGADFQMYKGIHLPKGVF